MAVSIKITGDESELNAANERAAKGAAAIGEAYKESAAEARRLEKVANQVMDQTKRGAGEYAQRLSDLSSLLARGRINQVEYNKALEDARKKFFDLEEVEFKPFEKHGALSTLGKFVAGLQVARAAAHVLKESLAEARQEADDLRVAREGSGGSRGQLGQLANSPEQLQSLLSRVDQLQRSGAASSLDVANRQVFAIESAGLGGDFGTLQGIGRAGLVADIGNLATAIGTLRSAFGPDEVGSVQAIVSKALKAAEVAPGSVEDILTGAAQAGSRARAIGLKDEEVLSAVATVSQPLGGSERARTALNALFVAIEQNNLSRGSLEATVAGIQGRVERGAPLKDVLGGSAEAAEAFRILKENAQAQRELLAGIEEANSGGKLQAALGLVSANEQLATDETQRETRGRRLAGLQDVGRLEQLRAAIIDQNDIVLQQAGGFAGSAFNRGLARRSRAFEASLGFNPVSDAQVRQTNRRITDAEASGDSAMVAELRKMVDLQQKALELQQRISQNKAAVPVPEAP